MTENDLLEYLLERLGRSETQEEVFGMEEVESWPPGALENLVENGLLSRAEPAESIECRGCEEYCSMPVNVLPAEGNRSARAFIVCDKPADLGRIPISLDRLKQWKITNGLLAKTLSRMLDFDRTPKEENKGGRWALGILKGKERKGQVILTIGKGALLQVAGHQIPLADILTLEKGNLALDRNELSRLVDRPVVSSVGSHYKPSVARRESRKLDTQRMYAAWQKEYRALKRRRPNLTDVDCSNQIAKLDIANDRDSETIRKHMKK